MCKQKQTITDNRSTLNAFPDKLVCVEAGKNKQTATKDCSTKDRCNFLLLQRLILSKVHVKQNRLTNAEKRASLHEPFSLL